ncbi:MAG TPA: ATP-binding cassette domain-containing protein, partial [Solirubrobacterales bacterium]|nr:ATP-binding cassette domain-containing protein [Solirubrobacterales bacterium]
YASLNPRRRVGQIVGGPLKLNGVASGAELRKRVEELLDRVGLSPEHYDRFPHEFSGGQRQRIGIARAIALKPKLIVADEPVSALDVSIQAQIVNLLDDLQDELGLAYVFVAHDIGVVRHISDRIAVMHDGEIVEQGEADQICERPRDEYTKKLLAAVPIPDPRESRARRKAAG